MSGTGLPRDGLASCPEHKLSILWVNHFLECLYVHRTFLWPQPKDAVRFV